MQLTMKEMTRVMLCTGGLALLLATVLLATTAQAVTATWTNTSSGAWNWTDAGNWAGSTPPNSGDAAVITNKTANAFTVTLNNYSINPLVALTLSNATLVITNNSVLTITNTFALQKGGILEIDNGGSMVITTNTPGLQWTDPKGMIVLNFGGTLYVTGSYYYAEYGNNLTGLVTATTSPGGTWNFGKSAYLTVGKGYQNSSLAINNVTVTNLNASNNSVGGAGGSVNNTLLITNGASVYMGNFTVAGGASRNNGLVVNNSSLYLTPGKALMVEASSAASVAAGTNNYLIITNGGLCSTILTGSGANGDACFLTGFGSYMLIAGTNANGTPAMRNLGNLGKNGLLIGTIGATGCWVRVDAGGIFTNNNYNAAIGEGGGASYNSLIITNGGKMYTDSSGLGSGPTRFAIGGYAIPTQTNIFGVLTNGGGYGNSLIISGPGSLWDWSLTDGITADIAKSGIRIPNAFGTNGNLIINNSGLLRMAASTAMVFECGNQVDNLNSNAIGNVVSITSGGTLEAMALKATNWANGNVITNYAGGVYQFVGTNPVVTSSGGGNGIYLNSGTIAFRGLTNADVNCNQSGKPLDSANNMTFLGNNVFRLNNATNRADSSQAYTFTTAAGAANFYRLEMVNGGTRYRGLSSDALTIGSLGQMLCSNTTATVDLIFANRGTLEIENSTLTLASNAVVTGTLVINMNNLSAAALTSGAVQSATNLTIGGTLQLTGTGTNVTLITYSGQLSGAFDTVIAPVGYSVNYGTRNNDKIRLTKTTNLCIFVL